MIRPFPRPLLYLVAALTASCSFVTDTCACVLPPPISVVYGTVDVVPANPVAQFQLSVRSRKGTCGAAATGASADHGSHLSGPGAFRIVFVADSGRHCTTVTARLADRSLTDSATVRVTRGAPPDSARLDFTFR